MSEKYGRKAYKRYTTFHGHHPSHTGTIHFPEPEALVCLGDAISITYHCFKYNGGGDGKPCNYTHKFAKGAKLFTDETGRAWLYIHGPKIKVEEPGIIN